MPIYQLKNELSKFIQAVEAGEEISITRRGAEVARLVPSATHVKVNRAEAIRVEHSKFAHFAAFDEREITAEERKW